MFVVILIKRGLLRKTGREECKKKQIRARVEDFEKKREKKMSSSVCLCFCKMISLFSLFPPPPSHQSVLFGAATTPTRLSGSSAGTE